VNESTPAENRDNAETAIVSPAELVLLESILPAIIQAMMQAHEEDETE
jgi:hypothetical protein